MNKAKEEQEKRQHFCELYILFYILIECALQWSDEGHKAKGIFWRSIVKTIRL